jgi:uncharacterized protein YaeQ
VALTSTLYSFEIDLSDADRGVYETLALRVARHPSESADFLVTRVLAYCLEYQDGIEFSRGGLSNPDDPPVAVRDLTGALAAWIDIGTPAAERLHRAAKSGARVAVYIHKPATQWLAGLAGARIHLAAGIAFHLVDPSLVSALAARLDRRMSFALSVSDQEVFVSFADATLSGRIERLRVF